MPKFFWIHFISICLYTPGVFCQQQYQFENYTTANGLSDNRVTCFYKDRTGFMWIGTENGLNRFDGHQFITFNATTQNRRLSNAFINDIEQDAAGRFWISTQNGLNILDLTKDSIAFFTTNNDGYRQTPEAIPSNLIWDTYIDPKGRVWIAADVRDLCYYDTLKKTFNYLPWKQFVLEKFPHRTKSYNSIRKIYRKSEHELWLGTSAGLFSYDIETGKFVHYTSYESDVFISLQSPGNKNIYYMQEPAKDIQVLQEESNYKKISLSPFSASGQNVALPGAENILWFPAEKSVAGINIHNGAVYFINHITDNNYSLPAGNVRSVYKDDYGIVWVATDHGVGKFNPAMNFFPFMPVTPDTLATENEHDLFRLKHNVYAVFYSSADENFYISSPRLNCLYIINKNGKRQTITHALGIPLLNCSVIREKNKVELYILSGIHVFIYNRVTKKFSLLPFISEKKNLLFTDMAEDASGNIWIACFNDGLYRYDTSTHSIWKPSAKDNFPSSLPTSLYYDKLRNKLWIGTFEYGVYDFDCSKNRFTNYNQGSANDEYIRAPLINDIIPDKNNNIWIATYADGISRLAFIDDKPQSQKGITSAQGLPENNVFSLAADRQGNIWATTFKGISKLSADGTLLKNYDHTTGLPYTDFFSPIAVTGNGEMIAAVYNGFVSFNPDSLLYHPSPFDVTITSFKIKKKDEFTSVDTSLPLKLAYFNNEVQFNFAALNYHFTSQTQYSYILEGQDINWSPAGNEHSVTYNNLAAGNYIFKVKATDFSGNASKNEASIAFYITPPLWQTWWFRLLLGAAFVCVIALAFRARIKNIRNKAIINQQIAELKGEALRAQMNPHFIFNSLNAIQELIVTENYTASYQYLAKFSKLLRSVLNMSEKNFISLSLEIEMCNLYFELESLRFKHSFHYSIDTGNIETDVVQFPTLLIQPFIENAIWHGLMQKEGEKNVAVFFTEKNDWIICTILDNGIGRERAATIKAGKIGSEHFTSKGISLARQRLESLIAAGFGQGDITINDCKDEAGYATGTEVKISIALKEIKI